jgi:hypothetical protein
MELLGEALPKPFRSELPIFSGGPVTTYQTSIPRLGVDVALIIGRLSREYAYGDIAVIHLREINITSVENEFVRIGIPYDLKVSSNSVALINAGIARGHERKTVVLISRGSAHDRRNYGSAIEAYIGASRAINTLVVVEIR